MMKRIGGTQTGHHWTSSRIDVPGPDMLRPRSQRPPEQYPIAIILTTGAATRATPRLVNSPVSPLLVPLIFITKWRNMMVRCY